MDDLRILIANEPRSYRDVLAGSFEAFHPRAEIRCADPADLDTELEGFDPHLIICSELSHAVEGCERAWVLLYPEGKPLAVVCLDGEPVTVFDIEFVELLSVVERVELLTLAS